MKKIEKSIELAGRKLTLSTGFIAEQADAAVMASYGETVVLATVVVHPLSVDLGYFPLTVDYQEKLYAGGRIKGSRWVKREGRPTDEEILTGRLIDRSIRPLFSKEYQGKEVQVITTVLSVDQENPPDILAAIASSATVAISSIPWKGPIGVIRVGFNKDLPIINPTETELRDSELNILVSSTKDAIVMIEAAARQVPEERVLEAIAIAQKESGKIIDLINDLIDEVRPQKEILEKERVSPDLQRKVEELALGEIKKLIPEMATKEAGYERYDEVRIGIAESFSEEEKAYVLKYFDELFRQEVRSMILSEKRPDGRKTDQIRDLSAEVGVLPRTHGSALFRRGQTQVLTITTLGAPSLEQFIETASGEETKRYIHHYSMPPFSTGEIGRLGFPNRREIGHGALAEKALLPVVPTEEEFPYTIRVVSEVLSSNGSTSMASVCGSSLSLMDAGVPVLAPVAGIAMGLVVENQQKFTILTDILGLEDANGDMDFKVAGTNSGVTALQLDVKTLNLTTNILEKALEQAKKARLEILEVMHKVIDRPRETVSKYAPKIKVIKIDPDKIGDLIGPGGKTIRRILSETGAQIDVDEDGTVHVAGTTIEELDRAISEIEAITKVPKPGEIYEGIVKRLQPFGAFIEIAPGKEGLVHISDMSENFVKDPGDLLKVGQKIQVRVKEIDDLGRVNLSMVLDPGFDLRKEERLKERKGKVTFRTRGEARERGKGGPHFPTSRFLSNIKKR